MSDLKDGLNVIVEEAESSKKKNKLSDKEGLIEPNSRTAKHLS